jgi:hypothetical protein
MTHEEARELEAREGFSLLAKLIGKASCICQDNGEDGDEWGDATWDFYFAHCTTTEDFEKALRR